MTAQEVKGQWALILGASSGFGEAICRKLSSLGMNIAGVHLDRKGTMPHVEEIVAYIASNQAQAMFFNANAANREKRREIIGKIREKSPGGIHCLVHSLAFGTLKPFIAPNSHEMISEEEMNMTCDVMAHSLVYWTQELFQGNLLSHGTRIFAMTSAGSSRVLDCYGAVSAAKSALESHCRQLASELAPHGVTVNAIRAGVTNTQALRKIPGYEQMLEMASKRNPSKRLTEPSDIADMIALLVQPGAQWLTGNVIGVDGGENIVG